MLADKYQDLGKQSSAREKLLIERSVKEQEEREKRAKEEEENKFDFSSFLLDKKPKSKPNTKPKGRPSGVAGASGKQGATGPGRSMNSQNQQLNDKKPTKRNGMTKR